MKIPGYLEKYFWDIDFKSLNDKNRTFISERILEYGDEKAVKWLFDNFSQYQIKQVLLKRRNFSRKSANYWSLALGLPANKIPCLNKPSQQTQKTHWPY